MKKLAVIILTGFFIVNQIIALAYGNWSVLGIVVPVVVIAIILYHFKEMD
jgi:hypothetical protein